MKSLHDIVFDVFGILPNDKRYIPAKKLIFTILQSKLTTDRTREIVSLYYFQYLTVSEISELLELNKSTVSKCLSTFRFRVRVKYLNCNGGFDS